MKLKKKFFHQYNNPVLINDADISRIIVSNSVPFGRKGFKYFIGYHDDKKIRPSCIMLPKIIAYRGDFDRTKCINFLIKNDEMLEKYDEIWNKVIKVIKKGFGFDNEPVYNKSIQKLK